MTRGGARPFSTAARSLDRPRLSSHEREITAGGWRKLPGRKRGRCRLCRRAFVRAATGRPKRFCCDAHRRVFTRREQMRRAVARGDVTFPIGIPIELIPARFLEALS